jgi:MFS family permease
MNQIAAGGGEVVASEIALPGYPKQSARLYLELSLYWFALSFLWAGMITVVIQSIVERLEPAAKDLYLGWSLGLGALVSTLVCIVIGAVSDRSRWALGRRRPYIIAGTLLAVPALLWLARIDSIPLLIFDFCLIQFWVNFATSPYQALMPDLVPKERQGTASSYMGIATIVGNVSGLLTCSVFIKQPDGLMRLMLVIAGVLVLAMLATVALVRERSAVENPAPSTGPLATIVDSFRVNPREHPGFFWLISSRFMINMGIYTTTQFLFYYVSDTLRAPNPQPTVFAILIIVNVTALIGAFPAGILADRTAKKRVVYLTVGLCVVAAFAFLLTSSILVAMGAAAVFGLGYGAFQAVDWALATNLLPERDEAKFMGIWHVAFTVPQVIAPIIGGTLAHALKVQNPGDPGIAYRVVLFLVVIYLAGGAILLRPIRERIFAREAGQ